MIISITMITAAILIIINSFIIIKDNGNDKEYEKNALNKDKKYLKTYKKIESMWMITLSSNNYNNNK